MDHPAVGRHVDPDHHGRPHLGPERQAEGEGRPSLGHVNHEQKRSLTLARLVKVYKQKSIHETKKTF